MPYKRGLNHFMLVCAECQKVHIVYAFVYAFVYVNISLFMVLMYEKSIKSNINQY